MKKKFLLAALITVVFLTSCETKPDLYIMTNTVIKKDDVNTGSKVKTLYSDSYLEISLSISNDDENKYIAAETIKKAKIDNTGEFTRTQIYIVNESGEDVLFNTSTEFLNYMADRGYHMENKEEGKYSTKYTFKKDAP